MKLIQPTYHKSHGALHTLMRMRSVCVGTPPMNNVWHSQGFVTFSMGGHPRPRGEGGGGRVPFYISSIGMCCLKGMV